MRTDRKSEWRTIKNLQRTTRPDTHKQQTNTHTHTHTPHTYTDTHQQQNQTKQGGEATYHLVQDPKEKVAKKEFSSCFLFDCPNLTPTQRDFFSLLLLLGFLVSFISTPDSERGFSQSGRSPATEIFTLYVTDVTSVLEVWNHKLLHQAGSW